ncbi:EAL domain-containing protein [Pelotomaculum propionicicum]|uniref:EAL domain-containing protein n=1 Tax=Pelotomaculum propionicicum TaxID=258475 RepID=UPI001864A5AD|nr:EAL domain-containing protein [Pelotomaculum propionicicum]
MTIALVIFEYNHPYLIMGFSADIYRYIDISVGLTVVIIANTLLFALVFNSYNKEHKKAREYLTQIEKQSIKIEFQESLKVINEQLKQEIAERKQAEKLLRESEKRYRNLVENINDVIFTLDTRGIITYVSTAIEKVFLYKADEVTGKPFDSFIHPDDLTLALNRLERILAGEVLPSEYRVLDKNGDVRFVRTSSRPLFAENQLVGLTGVLMDITGRKQMEDELREHRDHLEEIVDERTTELKTANEQLQQEIAERKQAEAQLKYLATHDYLTGIPNRYSFEESLKNTVAKAKRGKEGSLLFIDIDNFKLVNDTKGHTAGDHLLIDVAKIIKESIRKSDTLARLGGDEFGVLLEEATVDEARLVAEKLRKKVEDKEFCFTNYVCFNLSICIGIVMIDGSLNSQKLLTLADTALYAAKEKGRNRIVLLDPNEETTTRFAAINQLVAQVNRAVKEDKFVLHLQPVVRVDNGKTLYHEALLRLQGEEGELISPRAFIPAAERFGLMPQIDRWVVGASLDIMRQHPDLCLFVNISGLSLSEESLLGYIEEMITQCGMEPSRIGFEITETAAVKDMSLARRWIERLKKIGCRFALDDFGIGFSSFSYLQMLPVDYIKIDGSFIYNLDKDPSHRALVKAMNTVAHTLGKQTIAEYVENENVLKTLQKLKVDCAQGYFLGSPKIIDQSFRSS